MPGNFGRWTPNEVAFLEWADTANADEIAMAGGQLFDTASYEKKVEYVEPFIYAAILEYTGVDVVDDYTRKYLPERWGSDADIFELRRLQRIGEESASEFWSFILNDSVLVNGVQGEQ